MKKGLLSVAVLALIFLAMAVLGLFEGDENSEKILEDQFGYEVDTSEIEEHRAEEFAEEQSVGAATYYADLVCLLSTEEYWESFWDEFFDGVEQPEGQEYPIHTAYGYGSYELAEQDISNFWGTEGFKSNVKKRIDSKCPGSPANAGVDIDALLDGPLEL